LVAVGGLAVAGCAATPTRSLTGLSDEPCYVTTPISSSSTLQCASIDPDVGVRSNHVYQQYQPVPAAARPAAVAVAKQVPAVLARITAAPPITEQSVRAALASAFPRADLEVSADAAQGDGIGFGMAVGEACVHGWVSPVDQNVTVDGFSNDGGCLPLLGH
jgi:hypothetical protein